MVEFIKPSELPVAADVFPDDALVVDREGLVQQASPAQIADAGAPVASEAEAMAGVDNSKRMTPLRVKQVFESAVSPSVALARAWAESPTNPDPTDPTSQSSKTWAKAAEASAAAAGKAPKAWGDFQAPEFLGIADGAIVAFNDVLFERDRSADIRTTFLAGAGWVPFGDVISYKHFAISNSGDMTARARTMHNYANSVLKPVSYVGLDRVTLGTYVSTDTDRQIKINTDVDFGGCIVDPIGATIPTPGGMPRRMFLIQDPNTPLVEVSGNIDSANLFAGSHYPTRGLYDGSGYVRLNTAKPIPNRAEDGTTTYDHTFWMEAGWAKQALTADFTAYGNGVTVIYREPSSRWITLKNVQLLENGHNNLTLFRIERNQVVIDGFRISGTARHTAASTEHLIMANSCGQIVLRNVEAYGRLGNGSYVFSASGGAEVFMENCAFVPFNNQSSWGGHTTNFVNGLYVKNCIMNRVDAHEFGWNYFIEDTQFVSLGVLIGRGGGRFVLTRCKAYQCFMWATRVDYGGYFENCSVELYDCDWTPLATAGANGNIMIDMMSGTYGVGSVVPAWVPDVIVDGVRIHAPSNSNGDCYILGIKTRASASSAVPIYAPHCISIKNVEIDSNLRWSVSAEFSAFHARQNANPRCDVTLDNINGVLGSNSFGLMELARVVTPATVSDYSFNVRNCTTPTIILPTLANFSMRVIDTRFWNVTIPVGATPSIDIENCRGVGGATAGIIGGVGVGITGSTRINGLHVTGPATPYDISGVAAMSNVLLPTTNTVILPAGCTRQQAWTGWIA